MCRSFFTEGLFPLLNDSIIAAVLRRFAILTIYRVRRSSGESEQITLSLSFLSSFREAVCGKRDADKLWMMSCDTCSLWCRTCRPRVQQREPRREIRVSRPVFFRLCWEISAPFPMLDTGQLLEFPLPVFLTLCPVDRAAATGKFLNGHRPGTRGVTGPILRGHARPPSSHGRIPRPLGIGPKLFFLLSKHSSPLFLATQSTCVIVATVLTVTIAR